MSSYRDLQLQDLRLVMLRMLEESMAYSANAFVMHRSLAGKGHSGTSLDVVKTELTWLSEQGLVKLVVDEPLVVATLTARGIDVALGNARVPGVQRPLPE